MRAIAIVISILSCLVGLGQTTIVVKDAAAKQGLPYAHVTFSSLASSEAQTLLTDINGQLIIPEEFTKYNPQFLVKVSFIGMQAYSDTADRNQTIEVLLKADEQLLNEVVVTAQYAPNSPEKAVHSIKIIDAKKIESMAAVNLEDVLTNELNIRISQDAVLGSSIKMQGISGENIKIMIDGVPIIGRQDGNIDLNQINLNNIERIEIIEGPLSVNYGTNALAGTINLITKKKSAHKTELDLMSYNESIGTYNLSATAFQQLKKTNVGLTFGRNFFNGWSSTDAIEPNNETPVADSSRVQQWKPREQQFARLTASRNFKDINVSYRGEYFEEWILNRGYPRAPYLETAFDDEYITSRIDQSLSASGNITKNLRINAVAAYNYYLRKSYTYLTDLTDLSQTLSTVANDNDTSVFNQWMSRASINRSKENAFFLWELGYDINREYAFGRRIDEEEKTMLDAAVFGTAEINATKNLILRPGLRYTYNSIYDAPVTPSFNLKWQVKNVTFRGSYARGFRAPSLKELYFNFVDVNHNIVGNNDLKAEYSHNFSAKANYKKLVNQNIYQVELSGYYNDIDNLITLAAVDLNSQQYSYVNIGSQQTHGANTKFSLMHRHLKTNIGIGFVGIRSALRNELSETNYDYYPEITANMTYFWEKPQLSFAAFYKYQGKLPVTSVDENGALYLTYVEDYHMLEANVSRYFFSKRLNLSVGAKNIFNITTVAGNTGSEGAHSSGSTSLPIGMGRYYFLKANFTWRK